MVAELQTENKLALSSERIQLLHRAFELVVPQDSTPNYGTALVYQAALLVQRGEVEAALRSLELALQQPNCPARARYGRALILACLWEQSKLHVQLVEAAKEFEWTTNSEPSFAAAYFQFGLLLEKAGHPLAPECFKAAATLEPERTEHLVKLANIQMWREQNTSAALDTFEKALAIDPDFLEAFELTNFYQKYLVGEAGPSIEAHVLSNTRRRTERRDAHQLRELGIRCMSGIAPYIGHYCYIDSAVKMQLLGWLKEHRIVILTERNKIVNPALMKLWERWIPAISDTLVVRQLTPLVKFLELDYSEIPNYQSRFQSNDWRLMAGVQEEWELQGRAPLLQLSAEEKERGWSVMESMGIPRGSWFVAVHVRDDGFKGPEAAHSLRNADIATYAKAFEEITRRGGYVVRMGGPEMAPMAPMKGVVDYARGTFRKDWMDVFLWSQCRFFLGGNSGPTWIPRSFGTPTLMVNWAPLTRVPWTGRDLIIPKLFARNGKLISLREMVDPKGPVEWIHSAETIKSRGLIPIDNSPEELAEAVVEMIDRLEGRAKYDTREEAMQADLARQIAAICAGSKQSDRTCRLGRKFLERYSALL